MTTDLDLVDIVRLHCNTTNHEEVLLVEARPIDLREAVDWLVISEVLLHDKGSGKGLLVPATEKKHICVVERDSSHVTDLMRHLDGKHEPLWIC